MKFSEMFFCLSKEIFMKKVNFRMQPEIPGMLRRMMGIDQIFFCQRNVLESKERRLEITAWNESFDNRVTVNEKCVYWAEGNVTKFSQEAKLTISNFWGFESTVERLMIRQYQVKRFYPPIPLISFCGNPIYVMSWRTVCRCF